MELILCEKPKVGRDTARLLGIGEQHREYILCNGGKVVTWAIGHLLQQDEPEAYDSRYRQWSWHHLPIIPEAFKISPNPRTKDQLKVIRGLLKKASRVLIATDAGREGELIAREILCYCAYKGPIDRVWAQAQDDNSLLAALKAPLPGIKTEGLYLSALARQQSDWLVGMNMSRAVTLRFRQRTDSRDTHSIGRVKTPTLKLVYDRDEAIRNFVSREFFELGAKIRAENDQTVEMMFRPKEEERIFDRLVAENLAAAATGMRGPIQVKTEPKKEEPPKLFELTELQKRCNVMFGWSAKQTLDLAQALYQDRHAITYPRSDCAYLPDEQKKDIPAILAIAAAVLGEAKLAQLKPVIRRSVFDSSKVEEHNAIIPTTARPQFESFSKQEASLYNLIVKRYVAALMPAREFDETEMSFQAGDVLFKTKGQVTRSLGWRALYLQSDDEIQDKVLPAIADQTPGVAESVEVPARKTTPPKPYTEATLLEDMKSVAKFVANPEHKKRLKETSGIGTVATRAAIIEELKHPRCKYLILEGKYLHCTEKGSHLIAGLDSHLPRLTDPVETALWEDGLREIEKGGVKPEQFVAGISQTVRQNLKTLLTAIPDEMMKPTAVQCPSGKGVFLEGESRYQSPGFPGVRLSKVICSLAISAQQYAEILGGAKLVCEGFFSKQRKRHFSASLFFNKETQRIEFEFPKVDSAPPQPLEICCPKTNKPVLATERWFTFPGWPEVRCWRTIANRTMKPEDFIPALQTGSSKLLTGFRSKQGKTFDSYLVFNAAAKRFSFAFEEKSAVQNDGVSAHKLRKQR
jgi:DNA topoisomerase III